jgi:hypothetical protein
MVSVFVQEAQAMYADEAVTQASKPLSPTGDKPVTDVYTPVESSPSGGKPLQRPQTSSPTTGTITSNPGSVKTNPYEPVQAPASGTIKASPVQSGTTSGTAPAVSSAKSATETKISTEPKAGASKGNPSRETTTKK